MTSKLTELLQHPKGKTFHFIGIGGSSMSGLAQMLHAQGCIITGSDIGYTKYMDNLDLTEISISIGHHADHIQNPDAVIYTAAISDTNPEFLAAKEKNIPTFDRATLLGAVMQQFDCPIAISGTHGKTTTTSMMSSVFLSAKKDPTIHIGSEFPLIGSNVKIGKSKYFITEACEYKDSFHKFPAFIAIVLNLELDHVDHFKDIHQFIASFQTFTAKVPPNGYVICCIDDPYMPELIRSLHCNVLTYSIHDPKADFYAKDISFDKNGFPSYTLYIKVKKPDTIPPGFLTDFVPHTHGYKNEKIGNIQLSVPGNHNVQNSLASIATAVICDCDIESIKEGLLNFKGACKRYDVKGTKNNITVIDDYAHHPTEIRVTIDAIRNTQHEKLWCVFQPHTYTRLKIFQNEFCQALQEADRIILTDIYAAREKPDPTVSTQALYTDLQNAGKEVYCISDFAKIVSLLQAQTRPGDVIVTLGAGDVSNIADAFLA